MDQISGNLKSYASEDLSVRRLSRSKIKWHLSDFSLFPLNFPPLGHWAMWANHRTVLDSRCIVYTMRVKNVFAITLGYIITHKVTVWAIIRLGWKEWFEICVLTRIRWMIEVENRVNLTSWTWSRVLIAEIWTVGVKSLLQCYMVQHRRTSSQSFIFKVFKFYFHRRNNIFSASIIRKFGCFQRKFCSSKIVLHFWVVS